MSDTITLPREVVERVETLMKIANGWSDDVDILVSTIVDLRNDLTALRTALAAEQPKPEPVGQDDDEEFTREDVTTLLLEVMDWTYAQAHRNRPMTEAEQKVLHDIRTALAAEPTKHPGYVIGSHWLETAYSRVCAGEAEADVLRDIGLIREEAFLTGVQHLRHENERLREALKLALNSHGRMLMSDPPQDAWKFNRVDEVINAALRREET